jgi:hypothetical protein
MAPTNLAVVSAIPFKYHKVNAFLSLNRGIPRDLRDLHESIRNKPIPRPGSAAPFRILRSRFNIADPNGVGKHQRTYLGGKPGLGRS